MSSRVKKLQEKKREWDLASKLWSVENLKEENKENRNCGDEQDESVKNSSRKKRDRKKSKK